MRRGDFLRPIATGLVILAIWWIASALGAFPTGTVPAPDEVARAFAGEVASGRLLDDAIASLYRVAWGFVTAVVTAVPLGLVIGRSAATRQALLPWINFFRSLSPIAWIPFACLRQSSESTNPLELRQPGSTMMCSSR